MKEKFRIKEEIYNGKNTFIPQILIDNEWTILGKSTHFGGAIEKIENIHPCYKNFTVGEITTEKIFKTIIPCILNILMIEKIYEIKYDEIKENSENIENEKEIDFEQQFIEKIIELVKTNPNEFSARWSMGNTLDKSIQSKNKKILIYFTGQILQPLEPKMTEKQLTILKELMEPIVERDKKHIINNLLSS